MNKTELSKDEKIEKLEQRIEDLEDQHDEEVNISRRTALGGGALGLGALLGGGGALSQAGTAKAQVAPNGTLKGVNQIGTSDERVETLFVDEVDEQLSSGTLDGNLDFAGYDAQNIGSVDTERPVHTILDGQDAQSIIESGNPGTYYLLEPGSDFDIVPPFEPPKDTTIDGGTDGFGGDQTQLIKQGDGDLLTYSDGLQLHHITLRGNRTSHTGGGLAPTGWDTKFIVLNDISVRDMAADGIYHNATGWARYRRIHIKNCGGYGIYNTTTNYDGFRRSTVDARITDCDNGAIYSESPDRDVRYNLRCQDPGPAFHINTEAGAGNDTIDRQYISGYMSTDGGPSIYGESGSLRDSVINAEMLTDPSGFATTATPIGSSIHVDDSPSRWTLTLLGNRLGNGATDDGTIINYQGAETLYLSALGSATQSGSEIVGSVDVHATQPEIWRAGSTWAADQFDLLGDNGKQSEQIIAADADYNSGSELSLSLSGLNVEEATLVVVLGRHAGGEAVNLTFNGVTTADYDYIGYDNEGRFSLLGETAIQLFDGGSNRYVRAKYGIQAYTGGAGRIAISTKEQSGGSTTRERLSDGLLDLTEAPVNSIEITGSGSGDTSIEPTTGAAYLIDETQTLIDPSSL